MSNVTFSNSADMIQNLPVDKTAATQDELKLAHAIFQEKSTMFKKIVSAFSDILIIGFLFLIFQIPYGDVAIKRFIPIANSSWIMLALVKSGFFMLFYFILKNIYLVRK
jgi:hypothetical protein